MIWPCAWAQIEKYFWSVFGSNENLKICCQNWTLTALLWIPLNKLPLVYIGSKSFQLKRFGHIWHSFELFFHLAAFKNDLSTQCFSQISIGCDDIGGTRFQVFKDCLKLIIFKCSLISECTIIATCPKNHKHLWPNCPERQYIFEIFWTMVNDNKKLWS